MLIKITKKMILEGKPLACTYDPVAICLRSMGYKNITVGISEINGCQGDTFKEVNFAMPEALQDWLRRFDIGEKVAARNFEINEIA